MHRTFVPLFLVAFCFATAPQGTVPSASSNNNASLCITGGPKQSPIDIKRSSVRTAMLGYAKLYIPLVPSSTLRLYNNLEARALSLDMRSRALQLSTLSMAAHMTLLEIQFRAPSEHTIDGVQYPLEAQWVFAPSDYVYQNSIGQYNYPQLVMSTIYQVVADGTHGVSSTPLLMTVAVAALQAASGVDAILSWAPIFNIPDEFYTYDGSLTFGDCREDVTWYIRTTAQKVLQSDAQAIVSATTQIAGAGGNARATQPLNGRVVKKRPTFTSVYLN